MRRRNLAVVSLIAYMGLCGCANSDYTGSTQSSSSTVASENKTVSELETTTKEETSKIDEETTYEVETETDSETTIDSRNSGNIVDYAPKTIPWGDEETTTEVSTCIDDRVNDSRYEFDDEFYTPILEDGGKDDGKLWYRYRFDTEEVITLSMEYSGGYMFDGYCPVKLLKNGKTIGGMAFMSSVDYDNVVDSIGIITGIEIIGGHDNKDYESVEYVTPDDNGDNVYICALRVHGTKVGMVITDIVSKKSLAETMSKIKITVEKYNFDN